MKRLLLPWATFVVASVAVAGLAGCPPESPNGACAENADCKDGAVCAAGQCIDVTSEEGEGEEGEGEGEEGEGDGGEGEGEAPPEPAFRLEADVVGKGTVRKSGTFTLTGHTVLNTTTQVLKGDRFTLRGAGLVRGAP